jgi:hypothetical protein
LCRNAYSMTPSDGSGNIPFERFHSYLEGKSRKTTYQVDISRHYSVTFEGLQVYSDVANNFTYNYRHLQHALEPQLAIQRRGWYVLVVTHPNTSHKLLCVQCECVACLAFIIAAHLGNIVIFTMHLEPFITACTTGHS